MPHVPAYADELHRHLAQVVNILVRGDAPPAVRHLLSGASLVALPKAEGGLRPIAVGETLRRVVGKCLLTGVKEDMRSRLEPLQVGVGTPRGAEAAVHAARQWTERHAADPHRILVKVDLENAFNSVDRMAV